MNRDNMYQGTNEQGTAEFSAIDIVDIVYSSVLLYPTHAAYHFYPGTACSRENTIPFLPHFYLCLDVVHWESMKQGPNVQILQSFYLGLMSSCGQRFYPWQYMYQGTKVHFHYIFYLLILVPL
jgi:hypothetical protein